MKNFLRILPIACVSIACDVLAAGEQGTGNPTINVSMAEGQRIVLQAVEGQTTLIGSAPAQTAYGELMLDQYDRDTGVLTTDWGRAEVLLRCHEADVLVYRQEQGAWVEVAALTVATDVCTPE